MCRSWLAAKGGLALGTLGSSLVLLAIPFGLMSQAHVRERRKGLRRTTTGTTGDQRHHADTARR